jgi:hypothetical protein
MEQLKAGDTVRLSNTGIYVLNISPAIASKIKQLTWTVLKIGKRIPVDTQEVYEILLDDCTLNNYIIDTSCFEKVN